MGDLLMKEQIMLTNDYLANNLQNYIEKIGKAVHWVINRSGLTEEEYAGLLRGEYTEEGLSKLNKLFRIDDQNYFLSKDIKLPRSLAEIEADRASRKEESVYVSDPRILKVEEVEVQLAELMEKHNIPYDSPLGKDLFEIMNDVRYKAEAAEQVKRDLMNIVKLI